MGTAFGIRRGCVPRRDVVVVRGQRLVLLDILGPLLLRILLAMSILCHALRERRKRRERWRDRKKCAAPFSR
jgi:hypothetical protein